MKTSYVAHKSFQWLFNFCHLPDRSNVELMLKSTQSYACQMLNRATRLDNPRLLLPFGCCRTLLTLLPEICTESATAGHLSQAVTTRNYQPLKL